MRFAHLRRGGTYDRVCDPAWIDPSDTSFSWMGGGRWNPPDRAGRRGFGALYLNATMDAARANARRHAAAAFGATLDDLDDQRRPDLQAYDVSVARFVDAATPAGIAALGLAASYPIAIPHPPCQGIAEAAYAQHEHGIAVLSAVRPGEEELVVFDRSVSALVKRTSRSPSGAGTEPVVGVQNDRMWWCWTSPGR